MRFVFAFCLLQSLFSQVFAAEQTKGFWESGIINNVEFEGYGISEQQKLPNYNPDVFCQSQEIQGLRVPQAGEWNMAYKGKLPLTGLSIPNSSTLYDRSVGALGSEWGGQLNVYPNSGWNNDNYWVAEPGDTNWRLLAKFFGEGIQMSQGSSDSLNFVACVKSLI